MPGGTSQIDGARFMGPNANVLTRVLRRRDSTDGTVDAFLWEKRRGQLLVLLADIP